MPADHAYAKGVPYLHEAQHIIAQLRRAVEQYTDLTYNDDVLPRQR